MHTLRTIILAPICLIVATLSTSGWEGPTCDQSWQQLNEKLAHAGTQLEHLIDLANSAGIGTEYAKVSKVVVDRFQIFAEYDRNHPGTIEQAIEDVWWKDKLPENLSTTVPFMQLEASLEVVDHALSELQAQIDGAIQLKEPVDFQQGPLTLNGAYYQIDNQPVFPSKFTWMPNDPDLMDSFGRMGGMYYGFHMFDESGKANPASVEQNAQKVTAHAISNQVPHVMFLGHHLTNWMKEKHPETAKGARHFVRYDIDNPLIRKWTQNLIDGMLPPSVQASNQHPRIHLIANEPDFATRENGWLAENTVSKYTLQKYQAWLTRKYKNIETLNQYYDSQHQSFAAAREALELPLPKHLRGGAVWYDWCRFNMDRCTEWFAFLKERAHANDPWKSPISIKLIGESMLKENHDSGLDLEALIKLQEMPGYDFKLAPADGISIRQKEVAWKDHYAFDWRQQSLMLDFTKSLRPNSPIFDSEWHGFSEGKWFKLDLDRAYIRCALWMAFTHGMSAIEAWVWGRGPDGAHTARDSFFAVEATTQPIALDAFGRTMKELNAHADVITQLVPQERDFMVYYSEDSAIQDKNYIKTMREVYEAVKMLNVKVGFTTPSEIPNLNTKQTVIIPPTPYISDADLAAIKSIKGTVLEVEAVSNFSRNEYGKQRNLTERISQTRVTFGEVFEMAEKMEITLADQIPESPALVDIRNSEGQKSYGVIALQNEKTKGQVQVALINLSNESRTVALSLRNAKSLQTDLISGQETASRYSLNPYDVRLIQIDSKEAKHHRRIARN